MMSVRKGTSFLACRTRAAQLSDVVAKAQSGWPPDLFAVAATLIDETGTADLAVRIEPALDPRKASSRVGGPMLAADIATKVGAEWRQSLDALEFRAYLVGNAVPGLSLAPKMVVDAWAILLGWLNNPKADTSDLRCASGHAVLQACMCLISAADEASAGIGIGALGNRESGAFLDIAMFYLYKASQRTTTSDSLSGAGVVVLPKQHTPQRGLTLRSLTHHLGLLPPIGVSTFWHQPERGKVRVRDHLHILVLPWPLEFSPSAIRRIRGSDSRISSSADGFHYFEVARESDPTSLADALDALLQEAAFHCSAVDMVVLPELAMNWDEFVAARAVARKHCAILVGGIGLRDGEAASESDLAGPANLAAIDIAAWNWCSGDDERFGGEPSIFQSKHHRWCLDGNQIEMYGLDSRLPRPLDHWEWISIGPREFHLLTVEPWLTFGTLICEDLARQDPMATVVRTVAPNLLIALLLDGPQITSRWGARYATGLAEDPGTSVLTVTSLGFSRLSRKTAVAKKWPDRSRVIAHWRDVNQDPQCIELGDEQHAALLHVAFRKNEEYTADGRSDGSVAHFPVLSSWTPLTLPSKGAPSPVIPSPHETSAPESADVASR